MQSVNETLSFYSIKSERSRHLNNAKPEFYIIFQRSIYAHLKQSQELFYNDRGRFSFVAFIYGQFTIEYDRAKMITKVWLTKVASGRFEREVTQLCQGEMEAFILRYVTCCLNAHKTTLNIEVLRSHAWRELLTAIENKKWEEISSSVVPLSKL